MLTATDNVTELDISELVDMESEPGCEHSAHPDGIWGHSGPGWAIVRVHECPHCGKPAGNVLICEGSWKYSQQMGRMKCRVCETRRPTSEAWTLVAIL